MHSLTHSLIYSHTHALRMARNFCERARKRVNARVRTARPRSGATSSTTANLEAPWTYLREEARFTSAPMAFDRDSGDLSRIPACSHRFAPPRRPLLLYAPRVRECWVGVKEITVTP